MPRGSRIPQALEELLRSPRVMARVAWVAVAVGVALRIIAFIGRPSLWIDEAMLALNIATRSFGELLQPLDMGQLAPPLFLLLQRAAVMLGGMNEAALRAWPLVAGIGSLVLLAAVAWRMLSPAAAAYATLFFATSHVLVRYSNEAKQYSTEAFATTMLLLPAWIVCQGRARRSTWWWLGVSLLVAPLLSFTAALVIAGMLLTFLVADVEPDERRRALALCTLGAVVAAITIVHGRSGDVGAFMADYWQGRFLPSDSAGVRALGSSLVDIVLHGRFIPYDLQVRKTVLSDLMEISVFGTIADSSYFYPRLLVRLFVVASSMLIVLGTFGLASRHRARSLLVIGPIAAGLGASLIGAYPIAMRLWLVVAPLVVLLLAAGIDALASRISRLRPELPALAIVVALELPVAVVTTRMLIHPVVRREHTRPIVAALRRERADDDVVYAYPGSTPAWLIYSTPWEAPDMSALHAYLRAASPPDGPLFVNRQDLGPDAAAALQRSGSFGIELFGRPSGAVAAYFVGRGRPPFPHWADGEAERILRQAQGCVWLFETHVNPAEVAALGAALEARGLSMGQVLATETARATRYCRPASSPVASRSSGG